MKVGDNVIVWCDDFYTLKIGKIINKGNLYDHRVKFTLGDNYYYDEHELVLFGE